MLSDFELLSITIQNSSEKINYMSAWGKLGFFSDKMRKFAL